jgi:hypothetical protein
MLIYRPFIVLNHAPVSSSGSRTSRGLAQSDLTDNALEICIDSARSCARIAEVLLEGGYSNFPVLLHASHLSAGTLLIGIWNLKLQEKNLRAQGTEDIKPLCNQIEPLKSDVDVFMRILEWAEPRWQLVSHFL